MINLGDESQRIHCCRKPWGLLRWAIPRENNVFAAPDFLDRSVCKQKLAIQVHPHASHADLRQMAFDL